MAEKISVKTLTAIFLLCAIVLVVCSCIVPVDIQLFLDSPQVQAIIEKSNETVKLDPASDPGLTGEYRRISGLDPNKYYMIEKEIDPDGLPVKPDKHPTFVTNDARYGFGGSINDLGMIMRVSGGKINGLVNFNTYTVKSAKPVASKDATLPLKIPYTVDGKTTDKQVTNGVITVDSGKNGTGRLDLSDIIKDNPGYYEVMAVSVDNPETSPWNWTSRSRDHENFNHNDDLDWASFKLESSGTFDYVFYKIDAVIDFLVLRVKIQPYAQPVTLEIKITFPVDQAQGQASSNNEHGTISKGAFTGGNSVILTLDNPKGGGSWDLGSIIWSIGGIPDSTTANHVNGGQLTINNSEDFFPILVVGSFDVTVYAKLSGKPYSAAVPITVIE